VKYFALLLMCLGCVVINLVVCVVISLVTVFLGCKFDVIMHVVNL
jgi:hypothetical protein